MDKILFSERLAKIRKERGYKTQWDLAKAYNLKFIPGWENMTSDSSGIYGTIKHYENANHMGIPKLDIVCNLCELLNCDIDYLTGKIPVETHENYNIMQRTGLSHEAVKYLESLKARSDKEKENGYSGLMANSTHKLKVLSHLLENDHRHELLSLLYSLIFGEFNKIMMAEEGPNGETVKISGVNAALIGEGSGETDTIIRVGDMQSIFLLNIQEVLLDLRDNAQGTDRHDPPFKIEM